LVRTYRANLNTTFYCNSCSCTAATWKFALNSRCTSCTRWTNSAS